MRIAAVLYVLLSVGANFFIGNRLTFALAALSFPVLVWLLLRKRKRTGNEAAPHAKTPAQ